MDTATIIATAQQLLYWIVVFGVCLGIGFAKGLRTLIGLTLSLYIALLIFQLFPYQGMIATAQSSIAVFVVLVVLSLFMFSRVLRTDYDETAFEHFGKKFILAILASALIMAYSYHVIPITEFITPGSPIHTLFAPESNFFWWLIAPLAGLAIFGGE